MNEEFAYHRDVDAVVMLAHLRSGGEAIPSMWASALGAGRRVVFWPRLAGNATARHNARSSTPDSWYAPAEGILPGAATGVRVPGVASSSYS